MACYITGDIHGDPFGRLSTHSFHEQKEFKGNQEDNTVILCGDFGIVWSYLGETPEEKYMLDWLEKKNFTVCFVDGNHECHTRLDSYPIKEWNGGLVNEIRPHVLRLRRGEVFTIEGKKFFTMGGASSHDIQDGILDINDFKDYDEFTRTYKRWSKENRMFRVKNVSWWEEELPSEEEMQNGINNLEKHNWEVDFVISHCAPQQVASIFSHGLYESDILTMYFNGLLDRGLKFDRWLFGHYHDNRQIMSKFIMLYEQIIRII